MSAKSVSELFEAQAAVAQSAFALHWTRKKASLAILIASLSVLAVLLHERFGSQWLESAYAVVETEARAVSGRVIPQAEAAVHPDAARHEALAEFLAKRYKVSQDLTLEFVQIAHAEAARVNLDPLLIMAVISVESRYNPIAESSVGAKGLMQIIPKFHIDKLAEFGGEKSVFDPESNIRVGTRILREYLGRTGNVGIALQMYAGALNDDNDTYTTKVLGEKQRLQRVVAAVVDPAPAPAARIRVASVAARHADSPLGD